MQTRLGSRFPKVLLLASLLAVHIIGRFAQVVFFVLQADTIGLMVTYFGDQQSTVIFYHNDEPVATRYHFEADKSQFLPTITFENGPIDVDVWWQETIETIPFTYKVG